MGSLIGGISILSLFINFNNIELLIFKIIISILMIIISFGYKNAKYFFNNLIYLYLLGIILGGFLYFINDSLSYKNYGLIFVHNKFSINILLIILLSPIILIIYVQRSRKLKEEYSKYYEVKITFLNNKKITLTGYLDTGNNLYDPYKKRPILVIDKDILKNYKPKFILVPCYTVNKKSVMKCFKIKQLVINGKVISKDVLIGISDNKFNMENANILLHKKIIKGE